MNRAEHMQWAKDRAMEYVDRRDLQGALASMTSDLRKHEETGGPAVEMLLATIGISAVLNNDTAEMRRFIEGFN